MARCGPICCGWFASPAPWMFPITRYLQLIHTYTGMLTAVLSCLFQATNCFVHELLICAGGAQLFEVVFRDKCDSKEPGVDLGSEVEPPSDQRKRSIETRKATSFPSTITAVRENVRNSMK